MNKSLRNLLGLAFVCLIVGITSAIARRDSRPQPQTGDLKGIIPWRNDWKAANQEALANHQLLLVDFVAGWCPDCHAMAAQTWTQPPIAAALRDCVPLQIDVDAQPKLAQQFSVVSIPTLLLIDPSSRKILRDSRDRVLSPDELLAWLKDAN